MMRVRLPRHIKVRVASHFGCLSSSAPLRNFSCATKVRNESARANTIVEGTLNQEGFDPSQKYSTSQCTSCGINLQSKDPEKLGYFIEPKISVPRTHGSKNLQFISALSKLDDEGRKLLGMSTESAYASAEANKEEDLVCKRCHDALYHSVFKIDEHLPMKFQEVLSTIPKNSNILQVFSAYDFPLSLVRIKNRSKVTYVMNKADLLFGHGSTTGKYRDYFNIMVKRLTGSPSNPMIISAYTNWGISELVKKLEAVNHMVGYVNAGKTRLSNRLINFSRQLKKTGSKMLKAEGSSHLPALTREHIVHDCLDKTIVDVPGFLDESGVFSHIKEENLKLILEGKKITVSDLRTTPYLTVKGGQCYTNGGLFFLIPPEKSILQVKSVCQGEPKVFTNLEKARSVFRSPPEALVKVASVKPESMDELVRYVIPPFVGTIDLLIKDIGYVQIKPTGAKANDDLFEVWAPKGVVLGVRETIEHFLTRYIKEMKTKTKKVKQKDKTIRVDKFEKLKMKPKKVPDYKIFSKLYEIPIECSDPFNEMVAQYNEHVFQNNLSYHKWDPSEKRDETRNLYWIEKL